MSFTEIMVILLVAIIVIGPRQMPTMLRAAGKFVAQGRRWLFDMRSQSGIDEILKAEGLDKDIRDFRALVKGNMVEALSLELDRSDAEGPAPAQGAVAMESGDEGQQDTEYPVQGSDAYGASPEDREGYEPQESSPAGEGGG